MDIHDTDDDLGSSTVGRYSPERVHKLEARVEELEGEKKHLAAALTDAEQAIAIHMREGTNLSENPATESDAQAFEDFIEHASQLEEGYEPKTVLVSSSLDHTGESG